MKKTEILFPIGTVSAKLDEIVKMHHKFMRSLVKMVYADDLTDNEKVLGMQIALNNHYMKYLEEEE